MSIRNPIILLADDDSNDRILLRRSLKKIGIANPVFEAADGSQAIAYLNGENQYADRAEFPFPGILFLDLKMPGADGFEVLEWIRAELAAEDLLIIVLSRSDEIRQVNRAYALGARSFLAKPGTPQELSELIVAFRDRWILQNPPPAANVQHDFGNSGRSASVQ